MRTRIAVGSTLMSLALAIPALAQGNQDAMAAKGTVVSASDTTIVIRTDGGTEKTFVVDAETSRPGAQLAPGTWVTVRYRPLDQTRSQAIEITTLGPDRQPSTRSAPDGAGEEQLPQTASPIPLLALGGLIGLVGGAAIRLSTRAS